MVAVATLLRIALLSTMQAKAALASPVQLVTRTSHDCAVFVQRWWDNSFDVYDYGYAWTPASTGPAAIITVESVGLNAGSTVTSHIGSHDLVMTNVANPAVVNGVTVWTDPGKVSFVWGTKTWDSYSTGSPCIVSAVGYAGAAMGLPTTYTCYFTCDS